MKYYLFLYSIFVLLSCKKQQSVQVFDVTEQTTVETLRKSIDNKIYSIEDITKAYLKRIDSLEPKVNSILSINPDAIAIAKQLDAELKEKGNTRGALMGIPVILKDNISTKDNMPTTAGSRALADSFTEKDSEVASQLRKAGAIIIAKANLSEWANFRGENSTSGWSGLGGQTHNPYVLSANPCGSSAGSGVAVSANFAPLAIGTETNGSIICPSNANGIVGLKPTVGLISRTGIIPISYTQDTAGPMAKTVTDVAMSLAIMISEDKRDAKTLNQSKSNDYIKFLDVNALKGKRIGWWTSTQGTLESIDTLMAKAIRDIEAQGAEVIEIENILPNGTGQNSYELMLMEYEDGLNDYFSTYVDKSMIQSVEDLISFNLKDSLELSYFGQEYLQLATEQVSMNSDEYITKRDLVRKQAQEEGMDEVLTKYNLDAIIAPSGSPAWQTDPINGDNYIMGTSSPAAISGYPSITVPMGFVGELPVGISFFSEAWSEGKLIGLAYDYEQATKHRKAPLFKE